MEKKSDKLDIPALFYSLLTQLKVIQCALLHSYKLNIMGEETNIQGKGSLQPGPIAGSNTDLNQQVLPKLGRARWMGVFPGYSVWVFLLTNNKAHITYTRFWSERHQERIQKNKKITYSGLFSLNNHYITKCKTEEGVTFRRPPITRLIQQI